MTMLPLSDSTLLHDEVLIDGVWVSAQAKYGINDPATSAHLAYLPNMGREEALRAVEAASRAFPAWAAKTGLERAQILRRWFELVLQHATDLAQLMTAEQGRPSAEAIGEVQYAASFIEWFAEEAKRVNGDVVASTWADKRTLVLKQAIGVCAAITPWNFPLAMVTRKLAPALAAGCTVVLKPAPQTPLCALALIDLAQRAGIPAGVMNVVTADAINSVEIGAVWCASPLVRHLSFTGSTAVGKALMRQSAATVKKLSLELGGLAPFIVFDDADLDAAVVGAMQSKFRNAGQTCVCANRFYVHEHVYSQFLEKFVMQVRELKVGNGRLPGIDMGPLINHAAVQKVQAHINDALARGARLIVGGKVHSAGENFFEPTVLADVPNDALIMREETFGPVAAVARFQDEAEVLRLANDTEFGLAAYFYSQSHARVWRVSEALQAGIVGVNTGLVSNETMPFGGVKQSGLGREGSRYGLDEYLEMKYVCMGGM